MKKTDEGHWEAKVYLTFQIICYLRENISYLSGAQLEEGWGITTPALFVGGLTYVLAVFFFTIHQSHVDLLHSKLSKSPRWCLYTSL